MDLHLLRKKMTAAYGYSYTRLAFNYYMLLETAAEGEWNFEETREIRSRLNRLAEGFFAGEDVEKELLELRKDMAVRMDSLLSDREYFGIYDYVLKRIEPKFHPLPEPEINGDEAFTTRLMLFITAEEEAYFARERIRDVIAQLPVRLTKQKFYDMLWEGLQILAKFPADDVKNQFDNLRTYAMIKTADWEDQTETFRKLFRELEHMDYLAMTEATWTEASGKRAAGWEILTKMIDCFQIFQEMVNDLCVLNYAGKDVLPEKVGNEDCAFLVTEVLKRLKAQDYDWNEEEFLEHLFVLEGKQESCEEIYRRIDLLKGKERPESPEEVRAVNVERLLSGSLYAKLADENGEAAEETKQAEPIGLSHLQEEINVYLAELKPVLEQLPRPLVRAVMAKTLSLVAYYSFSFEKTEDYIKGSFDTCTSQREKAVCQMLLEDMMGEIYWKNEGLFEEEDDFLEED